MAGSFCKTCSIHIGHDTQLYSFLGSAVYIRPKQPVPKDNCVYLLSFREVRQRTFKMGTKLQPSVRRAESVPKSSKDFSAYCGLGKTFDSLGSKYCEDKCEYLSTPRVINIAELLILNNSIIILHYNLKIFPGKKVRYTVIFRRVL
jgi:hypothetical protein